MGLWLAADAAAWVQASGVALGWLLGRVARGLANPQIANALGLALPTVKLHIPNILGQLAVASRTEAGLLAVKHKRGGHRPEILAPPCGVPAPTLWQ